MTKEEIWAITYANVIAAFSLGPDSTSGDRKYAISTANNAVEDFLSAFPEVDNSIHVPDWADAPVWAEYAAMDRSGGWHWYEEKPSKDSYTWNDGQVKWESLDIKGWENTLQKRPTKD